MNNTVNKLLANTFHYNTTRHNVGEFTAANGKTYKVTMRVKSGDKYVKFPKDFETRMKAIDGLKDNICLNTQNIVENQSFNGKTIKRITQDGVFTKGKIFSKEKSEKISFNEDQKELKTDFTNNAKKIFTLFSESFDLNDKFNDLDDDLVENKINDINNNNINNNNNNNNINNNNNDNDINNNNYTNKVNILEENDSQNLNNNNNELIIEESFGTSDKFDLNSSKAEFFLEEVKEKSFFSNFFSGLMIKLKSILPDPKINLDMSGILSNKEEDQLVKKVFN
ncbi:MAG: hypothetical protein WDZ28_05990 [Simkaniaceae bacterium]